MVEIIERRLQVCPAAFWLKREDLADHAKHVAPPLFWRHVFFNLVGEHDEADLVVVANGGEREHGGKLGGQLVLGLADAAELARGADIDDQEDGEFALLLELLDVRMAEAGRDVPIDGTHLIARQILAHFFKFHPMPLENGMVLAAEHVRDFTVRADFDLPDFFEDFLGDHGTGTSSKIRLMTSSLVISSASAS